MLSAVNNGGTTETGFLMDDIVREGAQRMPAAVLEAEVSSTVKLRTRATRGAGSPAAALAMEFKLAESAQTRWRAITAPHLVALVRNNATSHNGYLVERPEVSAA